MHVNHISMKSEISGFIVFALVALAASIVAPGCGSEKIDHPWDSVRPAQPHTDHSALFGDSIASGPQATRLCLGCHKQAAREVMATSHWTWLSHKTRIAGHDKPVQIGKRNLVNNYCIGIESNWPRCTSCHAGYGWRDDTFDFRNEQNVDCLVCHDQTGAYYKSSSGAGLPGDDVDLLAVAKSVGRPTRRNCGYCHFKGGGGDAVKHGDMDGTFYFPVERIDVHMGKYNLECIDCHRTERHQMMGRALSVSADKENRLECTTCHAGAPHESDRLNAHVAAVACQTCHIPRMAIGAPTKMEWDWSTAGRDLGIDDPHVYLKAKGSFVYKQNIPPEYGWYNGTSQRYLLGDKIDPDGVTVLNAPQGSIHDPDSKIWPFKVHRGKQLYDKVNDYFIIPKLAGEGGYWQTFDWEQAARLGCEATGLAFSGQYGFARSEMYWPITHMVVSSDKALQCADCHGEGGRMKWEELGYDGDPAYRGSPRNVNLLAAEPEDSRR